MNSLISCNELTNFLLTWKIFKFDFHFTSNHKIFLISFHIINFEPSCISLCFATISIRMIVHNIQKKFDGNDAGQICDYDLRPFVSDKSSRIFPWVFFSTKPLNCDSLASTRRYGSLHSIRFQTGRTVNHYRWIIDISTIIISKCSVNIYRLVNLDRVQLRNVALFY